MKTKTTSRRKAYQTILWELNAAKEALEARLEDETEMLDGLRDRNAAPERIDASATFCGELEVIATDLEVVIHKLEAATKYKVEEDVRRGC